MKSILLSGAAAAISAVATHQIDQHWFDRRPKKETDQSQLVTATAPSDRLEIDAGELNRLRADHLELLRLRGVFAGAQSHGVVRAETPKDFERSRVTYHVFRGTFGGTVTNGQTVFFGGYRTHDTNLVFGFATPTIEVDPNSSRPVVKVASGFLSLNQDGLAQLHLGSLLEGEGGIVHLKMPPTIFAEYLDVAKDVRFGKATLFPSVVLQDGGDSTVGKYTPEDPYEVQFVSEGPPSGSAVKMRIKPIIADRD